MTAETSNAREWVLVPRELTQGMRSALARAVNASCNTDEWYAHTLAAAPQPPSAPVGVDWITGDGLQGIKAEAHFLTQHKEEAVQRAGKRLLDRADKIIAALSQQPEARGVVDEDALRDARTIYDIACIRESRDNATREDVEFKAICLRNYNRIAALTEARNGR